MQFIYLYWPSGIGNLVFGKKQSLTKPGPDNATICLKNGLEEIFSKHQTLYRKKGDTIIGCFKNIKNTVTQTISIKCDIRKRKMLHPVEEITSHQ